MFFAKRALNHPQRRKVVEYLAAQQGVTVEHFLEVIKRRKEFRQARFYRRRARLRSLERNPKARRRPMKYATHAGEGEFHALLREANMTVKDYAELTGYSKSTVAGWNGHPMHAMHVVLLQHLLWARAMAEQLRARGLDPEQFKPKGAPPITDGRYPRNREQSDAVISSLEPDVIVCPVHGRQPALGGECPKC